MIDGKLFSRKCYCCAPILPGEEWEDFGEEISDLLQSDDEDDEEEYDDLERIEAFMG